MSNRKPLSREDVLGVQDIEVERVEVPEWGGHVFVKGMSGQEREAYETSVWGERRENPKAPLDNIRAKLAAVTICDENKVRLFTVKDIAKLGEKSASALQRVFEAALRLSGLSEKSLEELSEELEKNPSGGSALD